jgi:hypothetical protein
MNLFLYVTISINCKKLEPKKHHRWEIVLDKYEDPTKPGEDLNNLNNHRVLEGYYFGFHVFYIEYDKVEKFKIGDAVGISFDMTYSSAENDEKLKSIDDRFMPGGKKFGATIEFFKNRVSIGGHSFFPVLNIEKGVKVTIRPWI